MKGYAMLKIGESGWIEKPKPEFGPLAVSYTHLDVYKRQSLDSLAISSLVHLYKR